ncbi:MAG: coenzyme F420-0:L-glutamate ligase [Firmicutes bacterium]|nr:coenzyme F420-0:L-glutamate ligase [Bacillota bacterium]
MERLIGTVSRGVRAPIIREGDDIVKIVADSVLAASNGGADLLDKDIVAVTESVVARAQANYATVDDIADDIRAKFPSGVFGIVFPIHSRNRFSILLRGFAKGAKKIYILFSYPADEVGNHFFSQDDLDASGVDPYKDVLDEETYRKHFGYQLHPFTGMDYVTYYHELIEGVGAECEIIFANDARAILNYTKNVLACDIHTRERTKRILKAAGGEIVYDMADVLSAPVNGSGYNEDYGLYGSNKSTEDRIKLFPRDCQPVVDGIAKALYEASGKHVEAMVYGDGAFKDPVGKIWELADPVVSPAYTAGLEGQPNELKLKYLADNDFKHLKGEELEAAIKESIKHKPTESMVGNMASQGTTPRRLTDLIGSLCDLTSGSGDKGTPIIWISGYFDNLTAE